MKESLRGKIVRITTETGPRSKNVLLGLARSRHEKAGFDLMFQAMRTAGEIVKYGKRKDAKWGAPGWVRPPRRRFS